ncbi:unnamed protein product [Mytilus coruscus]|uniref:Ig-like domain-containing protein n=1 Tax=Mytilus coruscus TaxID=42192 RepID=A0A6J8DHW1_MYTCO|nr:unnamed protein product [Mytilus coruscus]
MILLVSPEKPDNLYMKDPSALLTETDNATFICEGNVGKPKGKLIWRIKRREDNVPEVNTNMQTNYTKKKESCSYLGISSFTITLTDKDNQAVLSCAQESLVNNNAMFKFSQPINVLFRVRTPSIMKYPNISTYSEEIEIIILTCTSQGNPQPTYNWYFNETLIQVGSVLDIRNDRGREGGLFICTASNSYSGTTFVASNSVDIQIIMTSIIGAICGILAVIIVIFVIWNVYTHKCCRKSKNNNSTEPNNQEMNVYNIIEETEYERTGQPYTHLYNEISKTEKCTGKQSQSTEGQQEQ